MATQTQVVQSQLPAAFETYFKTGVDGSKGLIPQAFDLYGQGTPEAFKAQYTDPLSAAGLLGAGRVAGLTDDQKTLGTNIRALASPDQFLTGTSAIERGVGGLESLLNQTSQSVSAPDLQQFQMGPADVVSSQQYIAPSMDTARTGFRPDLQAFEMGPAQQVGSTGISSRDIQAAQTGFSPQLERFQMTAPERFSGNISQDYMSPFMQNVVEVQQRRAIEDAQKSQLGANLGAVRQGTYGGARQTLAQTERERGLREQLGDIQARGLETAFGQGQQQFERDRTAEMTAQRENLQAALGVQTLGTQTGLQTSLANLSNEQQARVTSEANRLQASGMTQDAALRAALANQQAGLTVEQQNLASKLGVQQLGTQTDLQTSLANLSAEQQANVQNQASQLQTQGLNAEQALRAALANQQAGLTVDQQNLQASLGIQTLGAGQDLEAQRANQVTDLQSKEQQAKAALGLGGLGQQLGQLGVAEQSAEIDRLKTLGAFGDLERAIDQQGLDARLADLTKGMNFSEEQLEKLSGFIRGIPMTDRTTTTTTPPPSFASQLSGMGIAGLGLYNAMQPRG